MKKILTNVDKDIWLKTYNEIMENPLKGLYLYKYTEEEVKKMDTKIGLVKDKKGEIKVIGLAIKDAKEENGELKKDEEGIQVKEPTALFSENLDYFKKETQDIILNKINNLVIEPKNYGENGEPNLILSLLMQAAFEEGHKTIQISNFGSF